MKSFKWIVVILLAALLPLSAQERAKETGEERKKEAELKAVQERDVERREEEQARMAEMKARLAELEDRLHSEKLVLEEQAKLAQEYAQRAVEMQKKMVHSPEFKAQMEKLQHDLQKKFALSGLYKDRYMDLLDDKESEQQKQIMKLEEECIKMSVLYKETKDAPKQQTIEKELSAKVEQLFDLREAQREKDIQRMTQDLTEMKKKLEERRLQKKQIVKKRLDQLLSRKDELEW